MTGRSRIRASATNPGKAGRRGTRASLPPWMASPSAGVRLVKALVIAVIAVIMLYPFLNVIAGSFSSPQSAASGGLFPTSYSLAAYQAILSGGVVTRALLVSIGITVVGTAMSMVFTVTLAYGLTRTHDVPGSKAVLYMVLFTMLFGAGIIPNYLLVKYLGMLNTYWSMILPGMLSAFNLVVVRNFFMEIPQEMFEAARIDGASEAAILLRIVLPLSQAVIAVVALFYAVGYWNNFFNALIYLSDTSKYPIQLVLNQYVLQGSALTQLQNPNRPPPPAQAVQMAVVVLSTLPILIVYPFAQRYFTKGVLTGAIKA